tara:strand:+ start:4460 stop:4846 length:387 start_codon:yes stop_codon:yes gene_type:complete
MVRETRIKNYTFSVGSLTSASNGRLDAYSERPLNGTIQKVGFGAGDFAANGSIIVTISGAVSEQIWKKIGGANADSMDYLAVYPVDSLGATGSPDGGMVQRVINSTVRVTLSGCGDTKTASGLTIFYI